MKFCNGDVVQLRSGGPLMTVVDYQLADGKLGCLCIFFNKNEEISKMIFLENTLKLITFHTGSLEEGIPMKPPKKRKPAKKRKKNSK